MIHPSFFSLGSAAEIAQAVEKQLAMYNYTFPMAHGVMFFFNSFTSWSTLTEFC